jgi:hypothetical protein
MELTAKELYELVKGWPREAWPDARFKDSDGKFVNVAKWIHGDGKISNQAAALMFTASGLGWLVKQKKTAVVHQRADDVRITDGWACPQVHGRGPTLLHALSAAINSLTTQEPHQ